jgi:repressor LexA
MRESDVIYTMLHERIKSRRLELGLSQEDLAIRIGKNQKQVWQYETGRTQPTAPVLLDLAQTLQTTADYLLGMTDEPEKPLRSSADLTEPEREIILLLRSKPDGIEQKLLDFIRAV